MKVPRGSKCGILPCVTWFKEFAERSEAIVMGTDRRADLDKAYLTLIEAVFKTIERVASEHPKTPPDVVKFGMCLFHVMIDVMIVILCVLIFTQRTITGLWVSPDVLVDCLLACRVTSVLLLPTDVLSRLKIVCLEAKKDIAKKKYRSHKQDYVKNCLGRPLDKLSVRLWY